MFTDAEKPYEKKRLRMFWTHRWKYFTYNIWEDAVCSRIKQHLTEYDANKLLRDAIIKLSLEKRITREEAENIYSMLKSEDNESKKLALTLMMVKKPKIFLKSPSNVKGK